MFSILGLDHVVLRAANVPRMVHFYCQVLGCTLERERPDLGLTQLRAGNSLIDRAARRPVLRGATWIICACASNLLIRAR